MNFKPEYPRGSTPLDPDELGGLLPNYIRTQGELNILEQDNILAGKNWALKYKKEILDESFIRNLHRKLYGDVWKWAGVYRHSQKTIGIDAGQISTQLHHLIKETETWIELKSYSWIEILARFHHRLVFVHPFPNGNGRYARIHIELLAIKYDQEIPTWGANEFEGNLDHDGDVRARYIHALKQADEKRIQPLIKFLYS